jgi:hypothetical protein
MLWNEYRYIYNEFAGLEGSALLVILLSFRSLAPFDQLERFN